MMGKLFLIACLALAKVRGDSQRGMIFSDRCPPSQQHYLLPHEWDCTKFYYCEYGMKWETPRDCAPRTDFSYALQVCIHPTLANCILPGEPPKPPTTTTTTTTTTTRPTTTSTTTGPNCSTSPDVPTTTTATPPTTTTTTTTTRPTTTSTTSAPICPTSPDVPTSTTTTAAPTTTTTRSTTTVSTTTTRYPGNGCPADFNVHHLLPHETDCDKFYYCVFGEKVLRECPSGTHFNAQLQVCDWPWNAGCEDGVIINNKCDECNVLPWAHETDCDKFWMCQGNKEVLVRCSLGLHFNPNKGNCDYICNAGCFADLRMCS